jgi:hypothetical protein
MGRVEECSSWKNLHPTKLLMSENERGEIGFAFCLSNNVPTDPTKKTVHSVYISGLAKWSSKTAFSGVSVVKTVNLGGGSKVFKGECSGELLSSD